jgi:hypothetical protein
MKPSQVLFTRYLLRQRLIAVVIAFIVCAITNVTVILASAGQTGAVGIILLVIIISV